MKGLIIENKSNLYFIEAEDNKIYSATARGKFKNDNLTPVVGDYVEFEIISDNSEMAVIENIEERKNYIKRPRMSNLTQIIFVVSCKHPKPDLLLLDKQLAFAEFLHIRPIIVLNKVDLDEKNDFENISNIYSKIGYAVINTNAKDGVGVSELKRFLKENISAFSGNSGVGKSSLINDLFKDDITLEGEISQKNKRGKNTTTGIKLYKLEENSYIADTPGFSTFDIFEIPYRELDKYFVEFKDKIDNCRYVGCSHIKEDECGIKEEVESGEININRYNNYKKIYEELKDKEEHKW